MSRYSLKVLNAGMLGFGVDTAPGLTHTKANLMLAAVWAVIAF
jgi:hypothetical protein